MQTGQDNIAENPTSVDQFRNLKRSTDVWFDDGNYVLQAEDTLFKVYGGVLSKYCLFFRTMLSLPQGGSSDQPIYENCPLIPLMGDTADEAGYFLKALFDLQFYADVTKIKSVAVVLGVVNMSLKYDAEVLLRRSLPAFTALYPATLAKWDLRSQRRQYAPFLQAYGSALPYIAIDIAKKTGMHVLLPSALLECCSLSVGDILDGVQTPNGDPIHLDHDSQRAVLRARYQLSSQAQETKRQIVHDAELKNPSSRLSPRAGVRDSWLKLQDWSDAKNGPDDWVDPLALVSSFPADAYRQVILLGIRQTEVIDQLKGKRAATWRSLPAAFGLQNWDKLERACIH